MSGKSIKNKAKRVGRRPKYNYTGKEFLSLIESYAKKGFTDREVALSVGLCPQTFSEKKSEYTEISEVLARARAVINATVRAKFLAMAIGGIKTKNVTTRRLKDKDGNITEFDDITETEIEHPPSLQAQSVWLYHHDEEWRNIERKVDDNEDGIPTNISEGVNIDAWIENQIKRERTEE
jgi:hypothetical protein